MQAVAKQDTLRTARGRQLLPVRLLKSRQLAVALLVSTALCACTASGVAAAEGRDVPGDDAMAPLMKACMERAGFPSQFIDGGAGISFDSTATFEDLKVAGSK